MSSQHDSVDKTRVDFALEASIHIGLAILLAIACLLILRPFIPLISWGIIIGVAAYPGFQKLQKGLGGRSALPAVLFTILLLALLLVPVFLLAGTLVGKVISGARPSRNLTPASTLRPSPWVQAPAPLSD